jgi:hypothetical protein
LGTGQEHTRSDRYANSSISANCTGRLMGINEIGVLLVMNLLLLVIFFGALFLVVRAAILSAEKKKAGMRRDDHRSTPSP